MNVGVVVVKICVLTQLVLISVPAVVLDLSCLQSINIHV